MAFFRKRSEPPEPYPPETNLAANVCGAARGTTRAILNHCEAPVSEEAKWQLYVEYVFLLLHLVDRAAYSRLPAPRRAAFFDQVVTLAAPTTVLGYAQLANIDASMLPSPESIIDEFNLRQVEYGSQERVVSDSNLPAKQAGSVLGAFFRHLPEPWHSQLQEDPWAVMAQKTCLADALEASQVDALLERAATTR